MKVLLIAQTFSDGDSYPATILKTFERIFEDDADVINVKKPEWDKKNEKYTDEFIQRIDDSVSNNHYDFVIAINEHPFAHPKIKKPLFKGIPVIELTTNPNFTSEISDYSFYHANVSPNKNTFFIGQAFDENLLYIEERKDGEPLTIFVDHGMNNRKDITDKVLKYLEGIHKKYGFRVLHQNNHDMTENVFEKQDKINWNYKKYPYPEISRYYRMTDVFFPTHRETQGLCGPEIGMCGGLSVLQDFMYPKTISKTFPHIKYNSFNDINWNNIQELCSFEKRVERREIVRKNYSIESMRKRVYNSLKSIKGE
jgi:hypothetical protein